MNAPLVIPEPSGHPWGLEQSKVLVERPTAPAIGTKNCPFDVAGMVDLVLKEVICDLQLVLNVVPPQDAVVCGQATKSTSAFCAQAIQERVKACENLAEIVFSRWSVMMCVTDLVQAGQDNLHVAAR